MRRPSTRQRPLRWLSYSNLVSSSALFVALGGSAYAIQSLPAGSVGRAQLQADSVTASKVAPDSIGSSELRHGAVQGTDLATGSVGLRTLGPLVQSELAEHGARGAQGETGPEGPAGPGATRAHFDEAASPTPALEQVMDVGGLDMQAECQQTEGGVQLNLTATAAEEVHAVENIAFDNGSGSPSSAEAHTGNLQFDLPAGQTVLPGPSAATGEYSRIVARLLLAGKQSTVEFDAALVIDGSAGTCRIDGVALAAGP